jgi:type I restriction enzyme S subunit
VKYLCSADSTNPENFLEEGDLLFTRLSGSIEYVANCAQVKNLRGLRVQYPDRLFRARLRDPSLGPYIELCFQSPLLRRTLEIRSKSSAGHQRVSMSAITDFLIPLPPSDEIREIVGRAHTHFRFADAVGGRVASATARAGKVVQAILAKAFRGDLG